jgi:hypothetical protein
MRKQYQTYPLYAERLKRKPLRMVETTDTEPISFRDLLFVVQQLVLHTIFKLQQFYALRIKTIQVSNPIVMLLILLFFVLYRNHHLLGEGSKKTEIWKDEDKVAKGETRLGFAIPAKSAEKAKINKFAPASIKELSEVDVKHYIQRFSKVAVDEMYRYGVPASISLAQAIIESRCGNSTLSRNNNNHFGVKCFSKNCTEGHCTNHNDDNHKDFFRNFDSAWQSWRMHSELLSTGKYKKLADHGTDYRKWAAGLEICGYASDKTYSEKLVSVIEKYDLHQFDL